MLFNKPQDKFENKDEKKRPPAEDNAHGTSGLNTEKRSVWLTVLPLVAVLLLGVLIALIVLMPKSKKIQLERLQVPQEKLQRATQPTREYPRLPKVSQTQASANKRKASRPESNFISPSVVSQLISTGAGIPPGLQEIPEVVDNPPAMVWKPADWEEKQALPAVVGDKRQDIHEPSITNAPLGSQTPEASVNVTQQNFAAESEASAPLDTADLPEEVLSPPEGVIEENYLDDLPVEVFEETPVETPVEEYVLPEVDAGVVAGGFYPTEMTAYVYGDIVNVRSDAAMDSSIMTEAHIGDQVYELESNGSWSRVRLADGLEGYIFSSLLSYNYVAPVETPAEDYVPAPEFQEEEFMPYYATLYSTFSGVNIRALPTTESNQIGSLYKGDSVQAIAYTGGWFQVQLADGSIGYVYGEYLSEEEVAYDDLSQEVAHQDTGLLTPEIAYVETPSDLGGGSAVANLAMQFLGYPYVYGAMGPSSFDCSGLACYVYSQYGASISRTTYDQVYNGIGVNFGYKDYSQMVPGDLLLFATGGSIGHAGIYLGGGQFIHAANPSTGVVIDDLNNDYWASTLAHVRRIIY